MLLLTGGSGRIRDRRGFDLFSNSFSRFSRHLIWNDGEMCSPIKCKWISDKTQTCACWVFKKLSYRQKSLFFNFTWSLQRLLEGMHYVQYSSMILSRKGMEFHFVWRLINFITIEEAFIHCRRSRLKHLVNFSFTSNMYYILHIEDTAYLLDVGLRSLYYQ